MPLRPAIGRATIIIATIAIVVVAAIGGHSAFNSGGSSHSLVVGN